MRQPGPCGAGRGEEKISGSALRVLRCAGPAIFLLFFWIPAVVAAQAKSVPVIKVEGIIDPGVTNYILTSIRFAEEIGAPALIIELDTPGGMLDSTKKIVQAFFDAKVPVVVFVSPQGASATSAGMMITIAGHVAVMAPGTNIGAAHPVLMPFGFKYEPVPKDDVMMEKATKDTAGWVRSICEVRKRNAEWAEKAVTMSESITATEAVAHKVVDGMADDLSAVVHDFLPGRLVTLNSGDTVRLETRDAELLLRPMSTPQKIQHLINNPNVILILFLLGGLLIALEFKMPGMIFPAVVGAGCILLALLAPSLPINYLGLFLILLAFVFFVAEAFIVSHGVLTVSGIIALVAGSLLLFNTKEVMNVQASWTVILGIVAVVTLAVVLLGGLVVRAHRQKVMTGKEDMIGAEAVAETDIGPHGGKIFIYGEYWNAVSEEPIAKGDEVVVKSVKNLLCTVERKKSVGGL